jgi:hypothetical protein
VIPRHSTIILVQAALAVTACLATPPAIAQQSRPTPQTCVLKAAVERSENASPLDPTLAPGNFFDRNIATALFNKNKAPFVWHVVPKWLVGDWHSEQQTNVFSRNDKTGKLNAPGGPVSLRSTIHQGDFIDKTGQVWQCDAPGTWMENDFDGLKSFTYSLSISNAVDNDKQSSRDAELVSVLVDGKTNKIVHCTRQSTNYDMLPISPSAIRYNNTIKTFDWQGNPLQTSKCVANLKKIGEFTPNPNKVAPDGQLLYPLFVQYLKDHDMVDRVPEASPAVPVTKIKP